MKWVMIIVLCAVGHVTHAMVITEIMYDVPGTDDGAEWIEVMNDGDAPVDLHNWKLVEGMVNHGMVSGNGDTHIPPGSYAIIADDVGIFLNQHTGFSGIVIDSAFSLSNTGETISLRNENGEIVSPVSYTSAWGAAGDGHSVQYVETDWRSYPPTPGSENTATQQDDDAPQGSNQPHEPDSVDSDKRLKFVDYYQLFLKPPDRPIIAHTVTQIEIDVHKVTYEGILDKSSGVFDISYGDGVVEQLSRDGLITHTWEYPGTYTMTVRYRTSTIVDDPIVSRTLSVRVTSPNIHMYRDDVGHIVIDNLSQDPVDVSHWIVSTGGTDVHMPWGVVLAPRGTIALSQQLLSDEGMTELSTDTGVLVAQMEDITSSDAVVSHGQDEFTQSNTFDVRTQSVGLEPDSVEQNQISIISLILVSVGAILIGVSIYRLFISRRVYSGDTNSPSDEGEDEFIIREMITDLP